MRNIIAILNYCFAFFMVFGHVGGYIASGFGFLVYLPKIKDIIKPHLSKTIIVFLIYGMIISYFSKMPSVGYLVMLNYFSHWLVPFVLGYSLRQSGKIKNAFMVFYFTFLILLLFSLSAYFGFFWKNIGSFYLVLGTERLSGIRNPIGYAALLTIFSFISFSIATFCENMSKNKKVFYFIVGTMSIFGVILTGSRGYYIAAILSIVIFLFFVAFVRKKFIITLLILLLMIFISFIGYTKVDIVQKRIALAFSGKDPSVAERILLSKIAMAQFKDNIFFGVGPSHAVYQKEYFEKEKIDFYSDDKKPQHSHIHSFYPQVLAEFGIVGFILFIAIVGQIFSCLIKIYKAKKDLLKSLAIGLLFGFISFLIGEFFDTHLRGPGGAMEMFWFVGLLYGLEDEPR